MAVGYFLELDSGNSIASADELMLVRWVRENVPGEQDREMLTEMIKGAADPELIGTYRELLDENGITLSVFDLYWQAKEWIRLHKMLG